MALSCIISNIKQDIGQKSLFFIHPAVDGCDGGPSWNNATTFGVEKLEWCGYQTVRRFDDMFSRFGTIPPCNRQTHRQTDILLQHSTRQRFIADVEISATKKNVQYNFVLSTVPRIQVSHM